MSTHIYVNTITDIEVELEDRFAALWGDTFKLKKKQPDWLEDAPEEPTFVPVPVQADDFDTPTDSPEGK